MAISADIDIKWYSKIDSVFSIVKIVRILLAYGWSFDYDGSIFYLPLGDEDFAWERSDFGEDKLMKVLHRKEQLGEFVGVTMTWKDTGIGGEFLFRNDCTISVCLTINRKILEKEGCTDVNWYLGKVLPALTEAQIGVESINFSENI